LLKDDVTTLIISLFDSYCSNYLHCDI